VISALSSGARDWKLIADERYKLILESGAAAVLYDMMEDPWETRDISSEAPTEVESLSKLLSALP
jgi:hypothetical protein